MAGIADVLQTVSGGLTNIASLANTLYVDPQDDKGITAQIPQPLSTNSLGTKLLNLALPSIAPSPPSPKFLFNYTGEDTVSLTSDITDHFVEDNTSLQDHISLKPVTVTTQGFIGELNNVPPDILAIAKFVTDRLATLGPFVPQITRTAQIGYNTAVSAYQTANLVAKTAVSVFDNLTGNGANFPQNQQQKAFNQFFKYWQTRTLFTVQTPWRVFQDMAILSLRAVQDDETKVISNFEITFKQIRKAQTIVLPIPPTSVGRAAAQASSLKNNGPGKAVESTGLTAKITKAGL